jgi:hypothetical protein
MKLQKFTSFLFGSGLACVCAANQINAAAPLKRSMSLSEKLPAKDLAVQFGNQGDPRFLKQLREIDQRISLLPGYRPAGTSLA